MQTVPIADGVYQFITAPDGYVPNGNSVAIVNDADVLVFDTFTRPSTAREGGDEHPAPSRAPC